MLVLSTAVRASLLSEDNIDTCTLLTVAWWAAWTNQLSQTWEEDTLTTCSCSTWGGPITETHIYEACRYMHKVLNPTWINTETLSSCLNFYATTEFHWKMCLLVRISAVAGWLVSLPLVLSLIETVEMLYNRPGSRPRITWVDFCLSR